MRVTGFSMISRLGRLCAALLLALPLLAATPALAQGQGPTGQTPQQNLSEQEVKLFQQLQGPVAGRVSIPDARSATLIQPAGKDWRDFWREDSKLLKVVALLGMLALLVVFFSVRGRIRIEGGRSGQTIVRFNSLERFAHWLTATCFILLALTGLNVAVGRDLVLPVVGPEAFTQLSQAGKFVHNYLAFPFTLGLVLMLVLWVKDNIPGKVDVDWLMAGGGLVGSGHAHARKFNGGQKIVFWSTILGGGAIAVTGFILMFPFYFTDIAGMQLSQVIHAVASILLIALIMAHIYIGSLGMEGAFDAMGSGQVDLNWARAHHDLWVEEMFGSRQAPRGGHTVAAE